MAGLLSEIAPTLTFPTDERKVRRGVVVWANWRVHGLLIARLKLREAMKIGFAGLELNTPYLLSIVMMAGRNSIFRQPI